MLVHHRTLVIQSLRVLGVFHQHHYQTAMLFIDRTMDRTNKFNGGNVLMCASRLVFLSEDTTTTRTKQLTFMKLKQEGVPNGMDDIHVSKELVIPQSGPFTPYKFLSQLL